MSARVALHTSILAAVEGVDGPADQARAASVLASIEDDAVVLPIEVLGELAAVLRRRTGYAPAEVATIVARWLEDGETVSTSEAVLTGALELVGRHGFATWDAMILAAAASAGCERLLTRDLQHGFRWRGVTVVDPFR